MLPQNCINYDSELKSTEGDLYTLHALKSHIAVTLPYGEEAHTAIRHIHTIDMNGYQIIVVVPGQLFDSTTYVPFLRMHSMSTVDKAHNILTRDTALRR